MLSFLFLSPHYSGAGFGPGIPGLHVGIGIGAGCGVGLGFGYGVGKGIALDENRRYSNVGHLSRGPINFPSQYVHYLFIIYLFICFSVSIFDLHAYACSY